MPTVSALWGDHELTRGEAAHIVSSVLEAVALVDPILATWRKKGRTRQQASGHPPIEVTPTSIGLLLRVNRKDVGREEMPELGFNLSAWNGASHERDQAAFSVTIGLHAANPGLRNSFVVDLPSSWTRHDARVDALATVLADQLAPDEVGYRGGDNREVLWQRKLGGSDRTDAGTIGQP